MWIFPPGGSFFFAENGYSSFKEIAGMISATIRFGDKTVIIPVEAIAALANDRFPSSEYTPAFCK